MTLHQYSIYVSRHTKRAVWSNLWKCIFLVYLIAVPVLFHNLYWLSKNTVVGVIAENKWIIRWMGLLAAFTQIQTKQSQENLLRIVRWIRWHCPSDTGFQIRALTVCGWTHYLLATRSNVACIRRSYYTHHTHTQSQREVRWSPSWYVDHTQTL